MLMASYGKSTPDASDRFSVSAVSPVIAFTQQMLKRRLAREVKPKGVNSPGDGVSKTPASRNRSLLPSCPLLTMLKFLWRQYSSHDSR